MPEPPPPPEDYCRIVKDLRPAIAALFAGYAIPTKDAGELLLVSIHYLLRYGEKSSDPRRFFLEMLEGNCEAWTAAREAEESPDDGSAPDA